MTHTPKQWVYDSHTIYEVDPSQPEPVALCDIVTLVGDDELEPIARRIVKCVSMHDELLEMLVEYDNVISETVEHLDITRDCLADGRIIDQDAITDMTEVIEQTNPLLIKARALIAKAQGA